MNWRVFCACLDPWPAKRAVRGEFLEGPDVGAAVGGRLVMAPVGFFCGAFSLLARVPRVCNAPA
jgi:hypothetical protein